MQIKTQQLSSSKLKIKVSLDQQEFNPFVQKAISELGEDLEVEGFRKGKVPTQIMKEKLDQQEVLQKAARLAVKEKYQQVVLNKEIQAIGQPEIRITSLDDKGLKFSAEVPVLPKIKLPDYQQIASQVEIKSVSVSEEELNQTLSRLRKSRAELSQVSRPAAKGDFVRIEFESKKLGLQKKDGFILGEGHFIPGFEKEIVGMAAGQTNQFSLMWSQEKVRPELKGQPVDFKVKLEAVQKVELPELTDEWVRSLGKFDSVEDLKKKLKQGLNQDKQQREKQRVQQRILEKISDQATVEVPEDLILRQRATMLEDIKQRFEGKQVSIEDYLEKMGQSKQQLKESLKQEAREKVKRTLILKEIAQQEDIEVSEQEIEQGVNQILDNYSKDQAEKIDPEQLKGYTEETLRNQKTLKFLEQQ